MKSSEPLIPGIVLAGCMAWGSVALALPQPDPQEIPALVFEPAPVVCTLARCEMPEIDLKPDIKLTEYQYQVPAADPVELTMLAQAVWGEARGVKSKAQQAAVIWCIFNRVDDPRWPDTIVEVCTPGQFHGYSPLNPIDPELYDLAHDVWNRWHREKLGDPNPGRTLPPQYVYFTGDGKVNHFRDAYHGGHRWDWSLPDPYTAMKGDT